VYRLEAEMPYDEMLMWFSYFEKRPQGWREDDRTVKMLQAQGVKAKPYDIFPSLQAIYKPKRDFDGTLDASNLKGSVMFMKMLGAKKGDRLDL